MSAFTVIRLPLPPHPLPSDWQSVLPLRLLTVSGPAIQKQESNVNVRGKKAEVYIQDKA